MGCQLQQQEDGVQGQLSGKPASTPAGQFHVHYQYPLHSQKRMYPEQTMPGKVSMLEVRDKVTHKNCPVDFDSKNFICNLG